MTVQQRNHFVCAVMHWFRPKAQVRRIAADVEDAERVDLQVGPEIVGLRHSYAMWHFKRSSKIVSEQCVFHARIAAVVLCAFLKCLRMHAALSVRNSAMPRAPLTLIA